MPSFESYDLTRFEFIMGAASRIRRAHPALAPLGYDGERVVGTARGRYVARPESAPGATS